MKLRHRLLQDAAKILAYSSILLYQAEMALYILAGPMLLLAPSDAQAQLIQPYQLAPGPSGTNATNYSGADMGAKINAACATLPASGGIVDARGFTGSQTITTTINCGSDTQPVTILFPTGPMNIATGSYHVCYYNQTDLEGTVGSEIGVGAGSSFVGTGTGALFKYCGSAALGTSVFEMQFNNMSYYNATTGAVGLDCSQCEFVSSRNLSMATGGTGLLLGNSTFSCSCYNKFYNLYSFGTNFGIDVEPFSNQNTFYSANVRAGASSGQYAIKIAALADNNVFIHLDDESSPNGALDIFGYNNLFESPYFEGSGPIVFESGAGGNALVGVTGLPGTVTDNSGNGSNYVFLQSVEGGIVGISPYTHSVQNTYLWGNGLDPNAGGNPVGIGIQHGDSVSPLFLQYYGISLSVYGFFGNGVLNIGQLIATKGTILSGVTATVATSTPPAVTSSVVHGTAGSTSYVYYLVCNDISGTGKTLPSPSYTATGANATLSSSNYISLTWPAKEGCWSWDILRGDTAHSTAVSQQPLVTVTSALGVTPQTGTITFNDMNPTTSAYTAPARNSTGDFEAGGDIVSAFPTSCTGHATGTLWNSSGTIHVC